ncbi:YbjQ family protein [Sinorhizobium fredii]
MQSLCRDCGRYKPEKEVQLGICDECFNHGAPRTSPPTSVVSPSAASIVPDIIITTSIDVPRREIDKVISIVAAEAALGVNVFRDIANSWRDIFGGRSASSQNALREARTACLDELKREAAAVGADAVIAVALNYNQVSTGGSGGSILFVAASGTAVKLTNP